MLRAIVVALGVLALAGAAWVAAFVGRAWPAALELGALGILILLGTFFEGRYRGRRSAVGTDWQTTGERFVDPTSGKLTEVRWNAKTGERAYVDID